MRTPFLKWAPDEAEKNLNRIFSKIIQRVDVDQTQLSSDTLSFLESFVQVSKKVFPSQYASNGNAAKLELRRVQAAALRLLQSKMKISCERKSIVSEVLE